MSSSLLPKLKALSNKYLARKNPPHWLMIAEQAGFSKAQRDTMTDATQACGENIVAKVTISDCDKVVDELYLRIGGQRATNSRGATAALVEAIGFMDNVDRLRGRVTITFNDWVFKYPQQTWEEIK